MYRVSLTSTGRRAVVSHDKLAKCWGIHLDRAKATMQCTTQRGVCTIANPALSPQFWTNDCMLWFRHLHHPVFIDTMFSNTYLLRNNKCVQVFGSDFGWVLVYPNKTKGKAHEAFSFQHEGIPSTMVMDGSKEQTLGKFCWKLVDAHCQLNQTKTYTLPSRMLLKRDQRVRERLGTWDAFYWNAQASLE